SMIAIVLMTFFQKQRNTNSEGGLDADVELYIYLGYKQVRFIIQDIENNNDDLPSVNAFDVLMNNSIYALTTAIWYLDPHLDKLAKRVCHLPYLFKQLNTDKQGRIYNEYYHASKQISKNELESIITALNLSLEQPWVTSNTWEAEQVNTEMNILYNSNTIVQDGVRNTELYTNEASKTQISSKYIELDRVLRQKDYYIYINLDQYLPSMSNQTYNFIKELSLLFPISIYRYHHENYLETKNFIWRVSIYNCNRSKTENNAVI
ncbi:11983_t:CDS:2, partial [Funneliformis mosseae]